MTTACGLRIYGSKGTILWFQEGAEKITIISAGNTIREVHRGYAAVMPGAAAYGRLPAGHPEGWFESMGNPYRSFTRCILAKREGTFTMGMAGYPTVEEGAAGLAFVEACLEGNKKGDIWVDVQE